MGNLAIDGHRRRRRPPRPRSKPSLLTRPDQHSNCGGSIAAGSMRIKDRPWAWQKVRDPVPLLPGRAQQPLPPVGRRAFQSRGLGNAHPVAKLDRTISDQLAEIGVRPDQIEYIGISHFHGDHTGQATQFPQGQAADRCRRSRRAQKLDRRPRGAAPPHIQPWLDGTAPVEALVGRP